MQGNYSISSDLLGRIMWVGMFIVVLPIGCVLVGGGLVYACMTALRVSVGG